MPELAIFAPRLFDGWKMHGPSTLVLRDGHVADLQAGKAAQALDLGAGILCPGFVDLQVNGGGGTMFNTAPTAQSIASMQAAHASRGTTFIAPTLISDRFSETKAAAQAALEAGCDALHLEGPHLDPARAGAHDPAMLRPLAARDMDFYLNLATKLRLLLTVAPGAVTPTQIAELNEAGVVISLGHSAASYEQASGHILAGAKGVTHLFNAMSGLSARDPGLIGAALAQDVYCGIIADGIHVHPANLRMAWMQKPERMFLVSDAMATLGSATQSFWLNARKITRQGDRLTLKDGTLAGAHLDLARAMQVMTTQANVPLGDALAMATRIPADFIGLENRGRLAVGALGDVVFLDDALTPQQVWRHNGEHSLCS